MEIDTNDYCGKSNVSLNSYALGYDHKISDKDYIGVFVGSSAGSFDFYSKNTATSDGNIDIEHAWNGGIYGMHVMGGGHYIDYLVHYSKFDNNYDDKGIKWGTKSFGVMILSGWKKQVPHGTINPYVSFSANKIKNDDMRWRGNVLTTQDQNNFGVKVGVDYSYNGGMFGGVSYSRGLSGHLASTVNDIALPSLDNDEQIVYLKLGYRGKLNQYTDFDFMGEKYLLDYDGWSVNGKLEFGF